MKHVVKTIITVAAIAAVSVFAAGCGSSSNSGSSSSQDKKPVKVGVTQGLHAEIMEEVKKEAAKQGIDIQVVEFSDFVTPDAALDNGELDMNSYQYKPFLDNMVQKKGLKLKAIGKTLVAPMAVYSHKYKDLKDLPEGGRQDCHSEQSEQWIPCLSSSGKGRTHQDERWRRIPGHYRYYRKS